MHKEPSARYSSAKQLAEELRRYQFAPLVHETPPADEAAKYKAVLGALASVSLVLLCVAGVSYLRTARERDGALRDLSYAEQQRTAAEEAQEEMTRALEMAKQARSMAEAERDHADSELTRMEQAIKAAEEARAKAEKALDQRKEAPAPDKEPDNADPGPEPPQEKGPPTPVEEGKPAGKTAVPAPVPKETIPPEADAGARPAGLTRKQLEAALPDLESSLKVEQTAQGAAIVVRVEGSTVPAGLDVLGFKNGDVITRVNRTEVGTIEEAKKALSRVKNDPGFSIRIIRDGLSAWMRVSVGEIANPKESTTPATPPKATAPTSPPAEETAKPETPPSPAADAETPAES
jgi:hypothetical protein